jgi:acetoacetate decarboxylase
VASFDTHDPDRMAKVVDAPLQPAASLVKYEFVRMNDNKSRVLKCSESMKAERRSVAG